MFRLFIRFTNYILKLVLEKVEHFLELILKNIFCNARKVDITMILAFDKIKELADKQGISLNTLEERLGYSTNYLYSLKKGNQKSDRLQEIADYFNVSTDYLLGRTDNPRIASNDTASEYTTEDLRKMARNAKTFDGKPLTDEDVEAITNIIEIYLKGRN